MRKFKLNFQELVYPILLHVERRLKSLLFLLNVVYMLYFVNVVQCTLLVLFLTFLTSLIYN